MNSMKKKIIALSTVTALTIGLVSTGAFAASSNNSNSTTVQSSAQEQKGDFGKGIKNGKPGDKGRGGEFSHSFASRMTTEEFAKLINESTVLTQEEKDKLLAVNTEVKPLREQLQALFEQLKSADDATKATLKTQIDELNKQIETKFEAVKDLLAKLQPQRPEGDKNGTPPANDDRGGKGGKGHFPMDLEKIISESTTLTQTEKDQLTAVNTEIKPLREQLQALFEKMKTADEATKATLKTQIDELNKQIETKLETVKDILSKVKPQRPEGDKNGTPPANDDRGGKGHHQIDLEKIISESTTLTQTEKDQLTAVNTEIKPLREQLQALFEKMKTADEATKATLKTQIDELNKQIETKLETVKDILAKVKPQKPDSKEKPEMPAEQSNSSSQQM